MYYKYLFDMLLIKGLVDFVFDTIVLCVYELLKMIDLVHRIFFVFHSQIYFNKYVIFNNYGMLVCK